MHHDKLLGKTVPGCFFYTTRMCTVRNGLCAFGALGDASFVSGTHNNCNLLRSPCNTSVTYLNLQSAYSIFKTFIYSDVLDIDLWTGMVTETKIGDSISGEVQSCLVAEQFANLRNGDRFWYETSDSSVGFTSGKNNRRPFFSVADS